MDEWALVEGLFADNISFCCEKNRASVRLTGPLVSPWASVPPTCVTAVCLIGHSKCFIYSLHAMLRNGFLTHFHADASLLSCTYCVFASWFEESSDGRKSILKLVNVQAGILLKIATHLDKQIFTNLPPSSDQLGVFQWHTVVIVGLNSMLQNCMLHSHFERNVRYSGWVVFYFISYCCFTLYFYSILCIFYETLVFPLSTPTWRRKMNTDPYYCNYKVLVQLHKSN